MINTPRNLEIMAERIRAAGVRPELEVFETGHLLLAKRMIETGHIKPPGMFQLCLGIPWGAPFDTETIRAVVARALEHGVGEAVATCGTALTAEHLKLLERHVKKVVLVFDGEGRAIGGFVLVFGLLRQLINELSNPNDIGEVSSTILRLSAEYLDRARRSEVLEERAELLLGLIALRANRGSTGASAAKTCRSR